MKKNQQVTAKDIANACHVSQATVSYVINNTAGKRISEEKRQEILETARRLNYFPNASARNIRQKNCFSIGLLPGNNYGNSGFGNTLNGIKKYLDSVGYTLTLLSDHRDPANEEIVRYYYSGIISGVILIVFDKQTIYTDSLEANKIPYVVISENGVSGSGLAGGKAFEHVIEDCVRFCREQNFQRIRYFTRSINGRQPHNKYDLIIHAVRTIYPSCDFERIVCDTTSHGPDSEIMEPISSYLAQNTFDIALTSNQRFGLLMQRCILEQNFEIPQRIKHICLASSPFLLNVYPQISSLYIPLYDMGYYAAETLMHMIKDEPFERKDFECLLIHGDTTKV